MDLITLDGSRWLEVCEELCTDMSSDTTLLFFQVVIEQDVATWKDTKINTDCENPEDSDKEATRDTLSVDSEGIMCSICLHDFEIGQNLSETKACGHIFHGDCIRNWLSSNSRSVCCPYCRADLITEADVKRSLQRPVVPTERE